MVTFALIFRPSTTPLEIKLLSLEVVGNQLPMLAQRPAIFFAGSTVSAKRFYEDALTKPGAAGSVNATRLGRTGVR